MGVCLIEEIVFVVSITTSYPGVQVSDLVAEVSFPSFMLLSVPS
jgi:hypothetical protein